MGGDFFLRGAVAFVKFFGVSDVFFVFCVFNHSEADKGVKYCVCMCVFVFVCVCVYMCECVYVCVCVLM